MTTSTKQYHRQKYDSARLPFAVNPTYKQIVLLDQNLIVPIYSLDTGRIQVAGATIPNPKGKESKPKLVQRIADAMVNVPGIGLMIKNQNLQTNPYDSGDFFDIINYNPHHVGLLVADSSKTGKAGIRHAQKICADLKQVISGVDKNGQQRIAPSADESFEKIAKKYASIAQANEEEAQYFCSVLYVDIMRGRNGTAAMSMVSAGHFFPIFYSSEQRKKSEHYNYPCNAGPAVGLVIDNPKFPKKSTIIREGEFAVLYSDGIVEAKNKEREMEREGLVDLIDMIAQDGVTEPEEMVKIALEELNNFRDAKLRSDDMTLMIAKIKEE